MSELQIALLLEAATWGSFGVTVSVFTTINQKRDLILRGRDKDNIYHLDHRKLMFYSDLIPMQAGISIFMGVFAIILLSLPSLAVEGTDTRRLELLCNLASLVPISGLMGYTLGGFRDIFTVGAVLSRRKRTVQNRLLLVETKAMLKEDRKILLEEFAILQARMTVLADRLDPLNGKQLDEETVTDG
jgi:hypothetical protein